MPRQMLLGTPYVFGGSYFVDNNSQDLLMGDNIVSAEKTQLMKGDVARPATCEWIIEGFSKLPTKEYSEIFYIGGVGWRLLVFPKGNGVDFLSIYLHVADSETTSQDGWSIDAEFTITVASQIDNELTKKRVFPHLFNAREEDWGSTNFMLLTDLYDLSNGYLVEDTLTIKVRVTVKSVLPPKNNFFKEPPIKNEGSSAERVLHIDPTGSPKVIKSEDSEGSTASRVLHNDPTDSAKITQSEEPPKKTDASSSRNEKSPADGNVVIEEHTRSEPLPPLFQCFGSTKVRNPPYSLPNGCRITRGAVLDEGDMAAQLIQSALLSSELQPLVGMPVVDLANQGYYHLAKFLHYHSASIINAQGLQTKHQENANALDEIKRRDLEIQKLELSLGMSVEEASQLRGDLERVNEEKVKVVDEFSAAREKITNLEGELQLLRSENIDLQIQLEDSLAKLS